MEEGEGGGEGAGFSWKIRVGVCAMHLETLMIIFQTKISDFPSLFQLISDLNRIFITYFIPGERLQIPEVNQTAFHKRRIITKKKLRVIKKNIPIPDLESIQNLTGLACMAGVQWGMRGQLNSSAKRDLALSQAAQAQDVNKLFNSDTVMQRTIYKDCMGNLPL